VPPPLRARQTPSVALTRSKWTQVPQLILTFPTTTLLIKTPAMFVPDISSLLHALQHAQNLCTYGSLRTFAHNCNEGSPPPGHLWHFCSPIISALSVPFTLLLIFFVHKRFTRVLHNQWIRRRYQRTQEDLAKVAEEPQQEGQIEPNEHRSVRRRRRRWSRAPSQYPRVLPLQADLDHGGLWFVDQWAMDSEETMSPVDSA
jgi:hypothetical protein